MRLLEYIKNIIIESSRRRKFIDKFESNDLEILLFAQEHQWRDRFGEKTFEEIKDIFETTRGKIRIGVPNLWIKDIFKKNFENISKKFNDIEYGFLKKSSNYGPRLLLIKNRQEQNELEDNPEIFDFIEFVIQKNSDDEFEIVTSAFSNDGNFLRKFNKVEDRTQRLSVESKFYIDYVLILND
jgi:hypothetical protein